MFASEALLRMATDYRRRADALKNPEQRARNLALAEYCERLGAGMVRRPGMVVRLWQAIVRAARRGRRVSARSSAAIIARPFGR
jgi:hypothetical protein